jgi:hypothetical protein
LRTTKKMQKINLTFLGVINYVLSGFS